MGEMHMLNVEGVTCSGKPDDNYCLSFSFIKLFSLFWVPFYSLIQPHQLHHNSRQLFYRKDPFVHQQPSTR